MENDLRIRRYISPTSSIVWILCLFTILPTTYIAFTDYYTSYWNAVSYSEYKSAAYLSLAISVVFFVFFLLGVVTGNTIKFRRAQTRVGAYRLRSKNILLPDLRNPKVLHLVGLHRFVFYLGLICSLVLLLIFVGGGYEKISIYGADLDKLEYRLHGDDRERVLTVLLQITRRLILPFCIIYLFVIRLYSSKYGLLTLIFMVISLVVGIATTLERSPLMLAIAMLFYMFYVTSRSVVKLVAISLLTLICTVLLGGVFTYIQYNLQDFSFVDAVETGVNFLINRAIMAPNFVPIELSYSVFGFESEKLLLRHSRLISLLGGDYLDAQSDAAIYVGPVGAIADIWRNLGLIGVVAVAMTLGVMSSLFDRSIRRLDPAALIAASFTSISLAFYLWYGVFFSQGVFFQIVFMALIPILFRKDGVKFRAEGNLVGR